ncbi:neurexin-4-like protein [Dinothrombium tinctorium]|uniref:Neurexin-4-like protein n=1 Tax=Dinothrombium tinctorium TaxID=1965070 RepID=A0A3S3PTL9_9ACAR|nr:neurexin-4-like protein [Dinothrombium tinctorium]RWS08102.1 neurexin-4-like protein [Dinothrombium tinctorium]RWS11895.1 neurexin-4-like protein [Dinothrombium tinctorium]
MAGGTHSIRVRFAFFRVFLVSSLVFALIARIVYCDSAASESILNFDGKSYVTVNIRAERKISSYEETFHLRFRTNNADGNILYSKGTQGDLLSLRLQRNKLVISLDLAGDGLVTSVSAGSLLDDNLWHDVFISRNRRDILVTVDRVTVREHLYGDFDRLDLNNELFIGGLPYKMQQDLKVRENFTGCIEHLMFNTTNIIEEIKLDVMRYTYRPEGDILYACNLQQVLPVTFLSSDSHLIVDGSFQSTLNISFDFRTFSGDGMLVYNHFSNDGFVKMYLDKGKLLVQLKAVDTPPDPITIDPFPNDLFNDGYFHRVSLYLERDRIVIEVNGRPSITIRKLSMQTGTQYLVGGGLYGQPGFIGCMRYLYIQGKYIHMKTLPPEKIIARQGEILFDSCHMVDRCFPNPCEHGGTCRQTNTDFYCDCSHTGYTGAVCRVSRNPVSCEAYRVDNTRTKKVDIDIDVDGSGPLEPFPVTCLFSSDSQTYTILHHRNEAPTVVQGYNEPGSYSQDIMYNADFDQILAMVNRSYFCKQSLKYECLNARLLNTPYNRDPAFQPFTWWVSRDNEKMDYWGGSLPGTRKCACGLYGTCRDSQNWCNCDSTGGLLANEWLADEGEIVQKNFLPIRQIRIGDTGQTVMSKKMAKYTIGPLVCEGNKVFDNVVTFRYVDASINLPPLEVEYSIDIYFQFKTTQTNGVLLHVKGVTDFLQLIITDQKVAQFSYNVGYGPQKITVETSYRITDNNWHSILIEVNKKEAKLTIDGKFPKSLQHTGTIRPLQLSSYLVIGATVDYLNGYVGCVRAFMLNGQFIDLMQKAQDGVYGVFPGCVGKCESNPCLNGGTCIEKYDKYECDCQWTAFKGLICADEIGVNLRSDNYVRYDFETTISTLEEYIRVGFTTTEHRGLILGISSETGEYLNLVMSTSGNLRLVFDFGFERQEIIIRNENFALGQHHDITIRRSEKGSKMTIYVDNYEPIVHTFVIGPKVDAQFSRLKSIYIGRNETMSSGDGFVGCISRVTFDDHFPLARLFQLDRRSNVFAFPNYDAVHEDTCGIESVTHPPEIHPTRPPPFAGHVPVVHLSEGSRAAAIIGGIIAGIVVIIIIALIASGRFVARHKGDYITNEDKGARDALDPDTAVVKGKTGPDISKKKEYFI